MNDIKLDRVLVAIGFLCPMLCGGPLIADGLEKRERILITFRYDDYSAKSPTELERRLFETFRDIHGCLTVGVVPFVCEGDSHDSRPQRYLELPQPKIQLLRKHIEAGSVEAALHGYSHQTISRTVNADFSGLSYEDQVKRMVSGKSFLEKHLNVPIDIFIPPWNRYDSNTLQAMKNARLGILSAAINGEGTHDKSIRFLPCSTSIDKVQVAVKKAREFRDSEAVIVVLFHGYDFKEIDRNRCRTTWDEFVTSLQWLSQQPDVLMVSVGQAVGSVEQLGSDRLEMNRRLISVADFFPSEFSRNKHQDVYFSTECAETLLYRTIGRECFVISIIVAAGLVAGLITRRIGISRLGKLESCVRVGLVCSVAAILAYALRDLHISSMKALILLGLAAGFGVGMLLPIPLRSQKSDT